MQNLHLGSDLHERSDFTLIWLKIPSECDFQSAMRRCLDDKKNALRGRNSDVGITVTFSRVVYVGEEVQTLGRSPSVEDAHERWGLVRAFLNPPLTALLLGSGNKECG
jgi:hypothetical protein